MIRTQDQARNEKRLTFKSKSLQPNQWLTAPYDTRPRDSSQKCSQINKSAHAIMWLYASCKPHKKGKPQITAWVMKHVLKLQVIFSAAHTMVSILLLTIRSVFSWWSIIVYYHCILFVTWLLTGRQLIIFIGPTELGQILNIIGDIFVQAFPLKILEKTFS